MQRRGANVMVEQSATLATATSLDVTNDVMAALNTALTTISDHCPGRARQPAAGPLRHERSRQAPPSDRLISSG